LVNAPPGVTVQVVVVAAAGTTASPVARAAATASGDGGRQESVHHDQFLCVVAFTDVTPIVAPAGAGDNPLAPVYGNAERGSRDAAGAKGEIKAHPAQG
jgi:hypothetical protein